MPSVAERYESAPSYWFPAIDVAIVAKYNFPQMFCVPSGHTVDLLQKATMTVFETIKKVEKRLMTA